jgi:hypothetical protein
VGDEGDKGSSRIGKFESRCSICGVFRTVWRRHRLQKYQTERTKLRFNAYMGLFAVKAATVQRSMTVFVLPRSSRITIVVTRFLASMGIGIALPLLGLVDSG